MQVGALQRQMAQRPGIRCFDRTQLVPVALPANSSYLAAAADAIMQFNKRGLALTVLLESTCRAVSAALRVQVGASRPVYCDVGLARPRKGT